MPSPSAQAQTQVREEMPFYYALSQVRQGKKISRHAWNNRDCYLFIEGEVLKIKNLDGKIYDLIVTIGDMDGNDWFVVSEE